MKEKLLAKRSERVKPGLDDKIILGWNALMISALCDAFGALGEEAYRQKAILHFEKIWENFSGDGEGFYHTYKNGQARIPAFLDDYAFLIEAAIKLQEISSDKSYLVKAKELTAFVMDNFSDNDGPLFYYTGKTQNDVILRKQELYDSATPSGNSTMAANLFYLADLFDHEKTNGNKWSVKAFNMLNALQDLALKYPTSFSNWLWQLTAIITGPVEVVIVGENYRQLRDKLVRNYLPGAVVLASPKEEEYWPILENRFVEGETLIYTCKAHSCQLPEKDLQKSVKAIQSLLKFG